MKRRSFPLQPAGNCGASCNAHDARNVTDIPSVTENPRETAACNGVTDKTPPAGDEHTYQPDDEDLEVEADERLAIQTEPDPFDIPIPPAFRRSTRANGST